MRNPLVVAPQPHHADGFVSLSRSTQGRLFEKHILNMGPLQYPGVAGGVVNVDAAFVKDLIRNFNDKVCDIVQVPLAGDRNEHTEDPNRNIGEVVGLVQRGKKIYVQIDVRDATAVPKMGKTLIGASAMLHLNYPDTTTGKRVGPALLHVCVTNRPYVTGLEDYQEILAATAGSVDGSREPVLLTAMTQEEPMTRDELIAELKTDHNIDVTALQGQAAVVDSAVALTNAVQDALVESELLELSNTEPTAEDMIKAIKGAGEKIVTLTQEAAKKDAEGHVDDLVRSGHILPKHRDAQVTLLLTNPELFDALLPEQPQVKLSQENGADPEDEKPVDDVEAEIARLTASPAAKTYIQS